MTNVDSKKFSWIFPFLLVLYEIPNYLSTDMFLPALPQISTDLVASAHLTQQTIGVWFLGGASLQLILGPLSDQYGRRPILLIGALCFILSTLGCALAPNIHILIITRFLQGCSVGVIGTAGYAAIHELYDSTTAIQVLAIMMSVTVLAPAFGPLLGSVVLQILNWRWIFGILMIWALGAAFFLWLLMPETNPRFQLKVDKANFNFNQAKKKAIPFQEIIKNYFGILSNPIFMFNNLIFCFAFLGLIAWLTAGPFLVSSRYGVNNYYFSIFQIMIFGSLILGAQIVKMIAVRLSHDRLINIGLTIIFLGSILGLIFPLVVPNFLFGLVISLMILSFGVALSFSSLHRLAIEACTEPMGARMAVFTTLMSIAGFLGSLLVSFTYSENLLRFGILIFLVGSLSCLTRIINIKMKKSLVKR